MKFGQYMYFDTIFEDFQKKKFLPFFAVFMGITIFSVFSVFNPKFPFDPLYLAFANWIQVKEGNITFNLSGHTYL